MQHTISAARLHQIIPEFPFPGSKHYDVALKWLAGENIVFTAPGTDTWTSVIMPNWNKHMEYKVVE
jgi:hypothetical protein